MASKPLALREDSGRLLPVQIEPDGTATFVLPQLSAGTSKRYRLEELRISNPSKAVELTNAHGRLTIIAAGRRVLTYQAEPGDLPGPNIKPIFRRGGYIHPVFTPSGRVITDDFPAFFLPRAIAAAGHQLDVRLEAVDSNGIPTEVFCGRPINPQPFHAARPMSGFKTGDMGLGHILVYARNLDDTVRFYRDLLGFRVSDFTEVRTSGGKVRLAFLHCNPRHHSIAILETPASPKRINHIMFECNSLDDVGSGRDLCLGHGVPIAIDLGRHMNDHVVSFYMANPSHFALEYGWAGRTIDDTTWQVEHYDAVDSLWGHPQLLDLVTGAAPGEK
jgi:catechol 2,3-dioxygenase-like lactoylglutathione lyase family enzyme